MTNDTVRRQVISLQVCVGVAVKWRVFCQYVKRFVDHRYFTRGILLAILVNTLSMGIEYHNQVLYVLFLTSFRGYLSLFPKFMLNSCDEIC